LINSNDIKIEGYVMKGRSYNMKKKNVDVLPVVYVCR